jgi:DNA-3-methyladenine glycosylase
MNKKLERNFFLGENVLDIAKDILGCTLVYNEKRTLITEVEAYSAPEDKASHAYGNRRTKRTETMFMEGGHVYVYLCYGIHYMFNIVTGPKDLPHAILIRAGIPVNFLEGEKNFFNGPGVLTKEMDINLKLNGVDLTENGVLSLEKNDQYQALMPEILSSPRIGIPYAEEYQFKPWRFFVDSTTVMMNLKHIKNLVFILFSLFSISIFAQPSSDQFILEDKVYTKDVGSAQFIQYLNSGLAGDTLSLLLKGAGASSRSSSDPVQSNRNYSFNPVPFINLSSDNPLVFNFDVFGTDLEDYYYSIIYCDRDWNESTISPLEFIEGFQSNRLTNWENSFNTIQIYRHFTLSFPNQSTKFLLSGNYVLLIYKDGDDGYIPAITKRFIVVEDAPLSIAPNLFTPLGVDQRDTHQEMDFVINRSSAISKLPLQEFDLQVIQNGDLNHPMKNIKPNNFNGSGDPMFRYISKISFPGSNEFRWIDMRNFRFRNDRVAAIEEKTDSTFITVAKDLPRGKDNYVFYFDAEGVYLVQNFIFPDSPGGTYSDYASTHFTLVSPTPLEDEDIYIYGELTNWQFDENSRMKYDPIRKAYTKDLFLKQGFYNYLYVAVARDKPKKYPNSFYPYTLDFSWTEGNDFETENLYTAILYYRPLGGRYDRAVDMRQFNSLDMLTFRR